MGSCCSAHLETKVRQYGAAAKDNQVTVWVLTTPYDQRPKCDYCNALADFTVGYMSK